MGELAAPATRLRGIDGCRAGWLVLSLEPAQGAGPWTGVQAELMPHARELAGGSGPEICAIDIPIGLSAAGPRPCDLEARRRLGPRRSSVFAAPCRPLLEAGDHAEACRIGRALDGRGVSLQTWNILAKIREVDALLRGDRQLESRVHEVHPELAFQQWNGERPLAHGKRCAEGRRERLALAEDLFPGVWSRVRGRFRRAQVADDDILDALALLRSAHRLLHGEAVRLPEGPLQRDGCGLPMAISF